MQNRLLLSAFVTLALYGVCTSCAVIEPVLDYPMSLFGDDGEEVETTVGDAIADSSEEVGGIVSTLLSANPLLAAAAGAAAAAAAGAARRKKKAALEEAEKTA